ncbi:MAG: DUF1830 domain-containing protein [Phormidesmis sp.]
MTYLHSLLSAKLPTRSSDQILCYYTNSTQNVQNIRVLNGEQCQFERIVFSKERILFEAYPEFEAEISSSGLDPVGVSKIDCQSLAVHKDADKER